jgi:hypothetical protein
MLKKLGKYAADALHFAAEADERAANARDSRVRADNELQAKIWRLLAKSVEFDERLETFLIGWKHRKRRASVEHPSPDPVSPNSLARHQDSTLVPAADASASATYRIWQKDGVWFWEVRSASGEILGFGRAASSAQARAAAFKFWLDQT